VFRPRPGEDADGADRCPSRGADLADVRRAAEAVLAVPPAAAWPAADTNGTYQQLVERANGLYADGAAKSRDGKTGQAADCFAAAGVYAAAWKKPGDPNVGTDWAMSLFRSGDIDGAVARLDKVLAANPELQAGHYDLGDYLEHRARHLEEEGDSRGATAGRQSVAGGETSSCIASGTELARRWHRIVRRKEAWRAGLHLQVPGGAGREAAGAPRRQAPARGAPARLLPLPHAVPPSRAVAVAREVGCASAGAAWRCWHSS